MLQKFNEKNRDIQIYVKDGLYHRSEAKVSVFDSVDRAAMPSGKDYASIKAVYLS